MKHDRQPDPIIDNPYINHDFEQLRAAGLEPNKLLKPKPGGKDGQRLEELINSFSDVDLELKKK